MRLTDCFIELIAYITYFLKTTADRQPPYQQVKADIERLISESDTCLKNGGFPSEDCDLARFAVFAWIDEAILSSSWNQRLRWQGERLQRLYFQTADAGELFFERLNTIGPHQRDVREVYYLCLAMGFMGRYCSEGDEYLLEQLKMSNLKLLLGSSVGPPRLEKSELFLEAYAGESSPVAPRKARMRLPAFALFCLGFPVVLYLGLFLIYRFILGNMGEHLLGSLP
jgi:type VI secretion system protein ImpK